MGARAVGVTDTASGAGVADVRVRERTDPSLAVTVAEQYVIPIRERVPSFIGAVATFRIPGSAAGTAQNLLSIENAAGSSILICVRSVTYYQDHTAATTATNVLAGLSRPASLPSGGTSHTKVSVGTGADAAESSSASCVVRGGASADGTANAITATPADWMSRAFGSRLHTAVGQSISVPKELIPEALLDDGIILRANQSLLASIAYVAAADNPATFSHIVNVAWEEYTLP